MTIDELLSELDGRDPEMEVRVLDPDLGDDELIPVGRVEVRYGNLVLVLAEAAAA